MSGGAGAQAGYVYQQDYAAFRVLGSEATRLLIPSATGECITAFVVEGRNSPDGPAWDVAWTLDGEAIELRECKDTAITRADRQIFYLRVRREIAKGTSPDNLQIGWVTDPGKQSGNIVRHLEEMSRVSLNTIDAAALFLPNQVDSADSALSEALYYLCHHTATEPPLTEDVARALLARLTVDRFRADELSASVEWLAPTVFQGGTGVTIRELIQGKLSTTIQEKGCAAYTREAFLEEVAVSQLTLDLAEPLREILTFHSAAAPPTNASGIAWTCRPDRPPTIWPLSERLSGWDERRSCVLVAKTGVGKTTASRQMFAAQASRMSKHHVLRVEAGNVDTDVVRQLPRLCSMLCGVSYSWLVIDGLDQIVPSMKQACRQTLSRLLNLPNIAVVITARREVVAAHDWMQELLSTLPEVPLAELSEDQIVSEFQAVGLPAPDNPALLDCLKNAYLFYLYAQTVSEDNMPLTERGEVTAFDILKAYWQRRVTSESQGFRAAGDQSANTNAKRAAAGYLADRTLCGDLVIERPSDQVEITNGIETLCREGVLLDRSTTAVVWSHSWLREFAAIERLVGKLDDPNAVRLAQRVSSITVDHAARNAAIGGCKWIVSSGDLGCVEAYLSTLYETSTALAREALTVLLEDSPRHLTLADLPTKLLIEALALAREMRAGQWIEQTTCLPDSLFTGPDGPDLNLAVFQYESELASDE